MHQPLAAVNSRSRPVAVAEWLVIALLATLLVRWLCEPENVRQPDYVYYYHPAGALLMGGQSPYGFITKWGDTNPMPPWFTLLIAPLSLLPRKPAAWCWLTLNFAMLAGIVAMAARLSAVKMDARRTLLTALALSLWQPVSTHLFLGQSTLLVTIAATGALLAAERGRLALSGVLMVAAASKPHLVFLLGLGLTIFGWRKRRSLAIAGGFAGGLGAALLACLAFNTAWVSDLLHKPPGVYDYWGITVNLRTLLALFLGRNEITETLYWIVFAIGSALVLRLWAKSHDFYNQPARTGEVAESDTARPGCAGVEAQPGRAVSLSGNLTVQIVSDRPLAELGALTLTATLLLTPYAQPHDYVLLIPSILLLAIRACSQPPRRRALLLTAIIFGTWSVGSLHHALLEMLESRFVWPRLESLIGENAMDAVWHGIKYEARFVLMLLPAGILLVLLRIWKKHGTAKLPEPVSAWNGTKFSP